jgi:predicted 3-demethylubiquinone-9 3-methyltransferase (glyoxalase superfamily)
MDAHGRRDCARHASSDIVVAIMARSIRPFLMFEGQAEAAMRFYVSLFPGAEIVKLERYGAGAAPGAEGTIQLASIRLADQLILCTDSFVKHAFTFTPASSLFVDCESEDEIRRLAGELATGGSVLMPLGDYGFSRLFTWVSDRFGVSWQLTLG